MGFNTAAIILNDALHDIRTDPEIGEKINRAIGYAHREGGDVAAHGKYGVCTNAITVLPPQHADTIQVVAIGHNTIRTLGYATQWDELDVLRAVADQMGYALRKKPARS